MKIMRYRIFLLILVLLNMHVLFAQSPNDVAFNLSTISSFKVLKVSGSDTAQINLPSSNKTLQLFIFLSPECPLSKNYTTSLNKLFQQYNNKVDFYGCISGKGFTTVEIQSFINTYKIVFPLFVDASKKLTNYIAATVTPEVILLNNNGTLLYKGAIDDWVQDLGKQKLTVSKYYLQDAITASLNNKAILIKRTKAYGCLINDY